jgi:predicted hotdog family 3-hydroxylacyl-ACP dehydratase
VTVAYDVAEFIPHRPPILGIDRLLALDAERALGERTLTQGADLEDDGQLWEPALIEGLAQTAAALHGFAARAAGRRIERGMLVGLNRLAFHRRARRGERIEYAVELTRTLEGVSLVHGVARVGAEVLLEGELKFYVAEADRAP